ncbi:uncharacterized protein LOC135828929 [Sycon ciliatum]|uniref:uncharacterized protein LOC135828929 n=1 Tax=Sycon ciliatum TaxID=27933 RepID=UPI0020AB96FA|eukprot:scpid47292/ scgid14661/ Alpha-galactosidase; Alpha-D-galactoside galactohydrolase; Melibiase
MSSFLALVCLVAILGAAPNSCNGEVAMTPPLGWNSWNFFACPGLNEDVVMKAAQAMVDTGLAKAGYKYINLDNCWAEPKRDGNGNIVPKASTFPNWQAMIDKIHSMGLKFGLYTDFGLGTCGDKEPGSYQHEEQDAKTYAAWKVDYVKDDDCRAPAGQLSPPSYKAMSEALNATGRPMVFSVKQSQPIGTAREVCNMRRVTHDIKATFYDMMREVEVNHRDGLAAYAGPGYWNDMDMLEVGNGNLTDVEELTHMAFWCLLKSPIILGNDLGNMSPRTLAIVSNANALAVNQDALGRQGVRISAGNSGVTVAIAILGNCTASSKETTSSSQTWSLEPTATSGAPRGTDCVRVRNAALDTCLSGHGAKAGEFPTPTQPVTGACNYSDANQLWSYDQDTMQLRHLVSELCLTIDKPTIPKYKLILAPCTHSHKLPLQQFAFDEGVRFRSKFADYAAHPLCLDVDVHEDLQAWAAPLSPDPNSKKERWAAVLFSRVLASSRNVTLRFSDLSPVTSSSLHVYDVWTGRSLGVFTGSYSEVIPAHGSSFIMLVASD